MSTGVEGGEQVEVVERGLAKWDNHQSDCLNNFDGDQRQKFALRMRCMAASGGDVAIGKVIPVKYWMVHEVEFINKETGDVVQTYRTVLMTPDLVPYAFVSGGVASGIQQIHAEFGTAVLDPPLYLRVEQKNTANKRRMYVLIPESPPADAAAKPAGKAKK